MKTKMYQEDRTTSSLVATFEHWQDAEQAAILLATANVFDYRLASGSRQKTIRSYRRVLCPKCKADYTYSELHYRDTFGDKLCDCGQRFLLDGMVFQGETAALYCD